MEVLIREEEPKNAAEQARAASVLFTLLGRVIHGVPDSELLTALANERAFDEVPFVEGEESEQAAEDARSLERWLLGSVFGERLP